MSDITGTKISQLPLGENLADDDLMLAVEDGISKKVEIEYLKNRFVGDLTLADLGDDSTHRLVTDAEKTAWNSKADESDIPTTLAELGDDSTHRLVTDTEKAAWDAKANVEANPLGEATAELTKVGINNTIYEIIGGETIYGEASGAIASFSDGSNNPLVKLEADINPIQDLHGYDSPWVGGAGKNKFNIDDASAGGFDISGETFTNNTTDTRATAQIIVQLYNGSTYVKSSEPSTGEYPSRCYCNISIDSAVTQLRIKHNGSTRDLVIYLPWTRQGNYTISFLMPQNNPTTVGGLVIKDIMICENNYYTPYLPYANICPISGRNSVEVTVADDTTDPTTEETYEITLGQTVYGGKLNVTTGELTVTDGYIASYNGETLPSTWISDRDVYAPNTSPTTGAEVVYKLSTPTEVTLTPTEVDSLLGNNNIWADSGDVDVVYIRDLNLFLTQLDARVKALENA